MNLWITTHWPVGPVGPHSNRHVYVKAATRRVPAVGDWVLVRESRAIMVDGRRREHGHLCHLGRREPVVARASTGRVVCRVVVTGGRRPVAPEDAVYDFGNLGEWEIVPCAEPAAVRDVPLAQVMAALGKPPGENPRYMSLWRVPQDGAPEVLRTLGM